MDKEYFDFVKDAYTSGLCEEYKTEIKNCHEDKLKLMRLAMRQQSIPYMATKLYNGVVSKEYMLQAYGGYLNGFILKDCDNVEGYTYAWYMDYDYDNDLMIETDVSHISFTVGASVVVPKTKCPTIYISNKSNIHLVCDGYNTAKIYLFDKSIVTVEELGHDSSLLVYKYSDESEITRGKYCLGNNIRVFNKKLKI